MLSIAGSDPSGGAGIQADLKAIAANGGYAMAAVTALTAQNTHGVRVVHVPPAAFLQAQLEVLVADIRIDAVKIGMVANAENAASIADFLATLPSGVPVVLDTVMVAKGGASLIDADAVSALMDTLAPRATVITPNLPEAAALLGSRPAGDREEMERQASDLLASGSQAVLLKGGHLDGADSPDLLICDNGDPVWFEGPRTATRNTHGTGCTLSSALATQLARALPLVDAVGRAKAYVARAIAESDRLSVGRGHGPLHHFHAFVPPGGER